MWLDWNVSIHLVRSYTPGSSAESVPRANEPPRSLGAVKARSEEEAGRKASQRARAYGLKGLIEVCEAVK